MLIGFQASNIHQIWSWMMMALGAGVVMPNVLRWYWWRLNGWGYAAGTLAGIFFSLIALFMPNQPLYVVFPIITTASLAASIIVSWVGPAVDPEILKTFFKTVRPFGLWKPVKKQVQASGEPLAPPHEKPGRVLLNVVLGIIAILGLYLAPMYLVGHWFLYAAICVGTTLLAVAVLYHTWYRPIIKKQ
jgi:hypothetical protein